MSSFVGIDLGWTTGGTGLAVVDDRGTLLHSGRGLTDGDIANWLRRHAIEPSVVAIDAPIVVPNASGQRVAERLIGRTFGGYGASAHTSNVPKFAPEGPRALRLADRFGWVIDPGQRPKPGRTVCIEVYPHPAMVSLFDLDYRIDYKKGAVQRRAAGLDRLADLLESVPELRLTRHTRWTAIRDGLRNPTRGDLVRTEDELDAIFCAHLAWLWQYRPSQLLVYGSLEDGYIVAPPPPSRPPRAPGEDRQAPVRAAGAPLSVTREIEGRPTGYASGRHEAAWKEAVRAVFGDAELPLASRVEVSMAFRLQPDQGGRNEPDLDNLVKSTIDALDGVLGLRAGTGGRAEADDVRVTRLTASKQLCRDPRQSGATVVVSVLPGHVWAP